MNLIIFCLLLDVFISISLLCWYVDHFVKNVQKKVQNMWMCSSLGLRQYLLDILKSNQPLMHINLFVFERVSRGYLARLNRSSVEEVMAVIRTLRCPENLTRPGELLPYNSTRPGGVIMPARFQRVPKKSHPAG